MAALNPREWRKKKKLGQKVPENAVLLFILGKRSQKVTNLFQIYATKKEEKIGKKKKKKISFLPSEIIAFFGDAFRGSVFCAKKYFILVLNDHLIFKEDFKVKEKRCIFLLQDVFFL